VGKSVASSSFEPPTTSSPFDSFRETNYSVCIGQGARDFAKATNLLFSFANINSLTWAKVVLLKKNRSSATSVVKGDVLGTLVRCYGLVWALNPCRVVCAEKKGALSQIAFSTLRGHLIAGEERFRVIMDDQGLVFFDAYSFTKGSGVLGTLAMPLIRPLQRAFFNDQGAAMKAHMVDKSGKQK